MPWCIPGASLAIVLAVIAPGLSSDRVSRPEALELPSEGGTTLSNGGWIHNAPRGSGVPADLFARALTSLSSYYRDDYEALHAHLEEEHEIFLQESPNAARPYLCCTEYSKGLALKSALESACGSKELVRTALNNRGFDAYCAISRLTPVAATSAQTVVHDDARCSPLTHAAKEPLSLLTLATPASGDSSTSPPFGLRIASSLGSGLDRGLVVTLSPGSLPVEKAAVARGETSGIRGGTVEGHQLAEVEARREPSSLVIGVLEENWRAFWGDARRLGVPGGLADLIPWTRPSRSAGESSGDGSGDRKKSLVVLRDDVDIVGRTSRAQKFHSGKIAGYKAALEHLDEKMAAEGTVLAAACGWDDNLSLVHRRNDVILIRGIHRDDHDETTAAACFLGLVGFLSAQPDVVHIHPEARMEVLNKVLTAYVEGGDPSETPMRDAGLDGTGQVIGLSDTGLDDSSCFFRDDDNGQVPRTSVEDAAFYPEQRKVIQYVDYADGWDSSGHGTHVAGTAVGKITEDWETKWTEEVSPEICSKNNMTLSCLGVCVGEMVATSCHWNPELACPMSDCDEDISCDEYTDYIFPCFDDPAEEIPAASGMAPGAKLAFFDIGTSDGSLTMPDEISDIWDAQYAAGARIMSNSWSMITMTEPSSKDVELDEWIHDNPDALVVFGAGNNGFEDGGFNPGSVQSPATAKTAMTVGASNSGPERAYAYYTTASSNFDGVLWPYDDVSFEVSPYSARGPVGEFTAKPDVVAPGLMVHSAKASLSEEAQETCALDSLGGTSMSAPAIAGAAALVRQYFSDGFLADYLDGEGLCDEGSAYDRAGLCEAFEPSGYLVKAILINSAVWLGDMQTVSYEDTERWMEVLDFAQGFGAVQLSSTIPTADNQRGAFFHDNSLASDDLFYYLIYVDDPSKDLSMTVAWYDPPSTVSAYNLLHDLDTYVMSVDTGAYFRSNSYSTIEALCEEDDDCADKYGFTYATKLADHMNPVERTVVSAEDLEEGYYILAVRARTLTESDTQAYGLAASGGGLELRDLSDSWDNLGLETLSNQEPNPDEEEVAPTVFPTEFLETPSPSSTGSVVETPGTAAPTDVDPYRNAEPAISSTDHGVDDDWFKSSSESGSSASSSDTSSTTTTSSAAASSTMTSSVAAGDDDVKGTAVRETDLLPGGGDGEDGSEWASGPKVAIAATCAGAALLIAVGVCFACRRRARKNNGVKVSGQGVELPRLVENGADQGRRSAGGDDGGHLPVTRAYHLPGYATAVTSGPEEAGRALVRTQSGGEGMELGADDQSEVAGFYAAVDPNAVTKLVGWGISRDFARVALRRMDNDIAEALKLIAEGNMDKMLMLDHEEMARDGIVVATATADHETEQAMETTNATSRSAM